MAEPLRRTVKEAAGRLLYATGLHRRLLRGKALVVAFHTIGEHGSKNSIQVSPALFREYCTFFKRHFDVVPLASLLEDIEAGRDVSGKLVITFDDGYKDNYTHGAPALEAAGLPATFFITTDFIGSTTVPWWDRDSGVESEWMTWDEVIDLDRRGFDIGAHTQSHANLRFSSEEGAREEIEGSKAVIEQHLGHAIEHFAYPYGRRDDINDAVRELVAEAGFRCCVSCYGGVTGSDSDAMDLPRLPINDWYGSPYQFGLDAVRDVTATGGEYDDTVPAGERVLVASYHLYPDAAVGARRPSELMRFLADKGYTVDGIGGRLGRKAQADPALAERLDGLPVMRVPQPPSLMDWVWRQAKALKAALMPPRVTAETSATAGEGGERKGESFTDALRRHYNALYSLYDAHKLWAVLSMLRLVVARFGRRYDIVISSGPPSASHLVGYVGAKLSRARYVMDFRDPWVGNSHVSPASDSRLRQWLENSAERACMRRADLVVVTTPGIQRMLVGRYPEWAEKVHVIYNGYDGEPKPPPAEPPGRMDMLYAGTLYLNRNPFPLLEALKLFLEEPDVDRDKVTLTFVGQCESWNGRSLREWVAANAMEDVVRILPPVSRNEIDEMTEKATVLVNLAQGQPDQIPAKTFDYIASSRFVLHLSETYSESSQVMEIAGFSLVVDTNSRAEFANQLEEVYRAVAIGQSATLHCNRTTIQWSREYSNHKWINTITSSCSRE